MPASKFLSMGKSEFVYYVKDGHAIHLDMSGTMAVWEATTEFDGFYDQDGNHVSEEIASVYRHFLQKTTSVGATVERLIEYLIKAISSKELGIIKSVPKMTKVIAQGLDKIYEPMTFCETEDGVLEFVCFGTRTAITNALDAIGATSLTISPLMYYYATGFPGAPTYARAGNIVIFTNKDKSMAGLVMEIDLEIRESLINSE